MLPMKPRRLAGWRALFMVVAIAFAGCRPPSQIESDAAFGEVDALFTAVTSHRTDLLEQCQQRLEKLSQQGDVSTQVFQELTTICEKANAGQWQTATERLFQFMRGQRRRKPIH